MNNLNDIFFTPAADDDLTYDQILEDVQRYFSESHASTITEASEEDTDKATAVLKELMVRCTVKRKYTADGLTTKGLCGKLYEDMAGYSFLNQWIYRPGVEKVNSATRSWLKRLGTKHKNVTKFGLGELIIR